MPKSKYLAKKTVVDGITFDSKKEANHYIELKRLQEQGLISDLQMQVPFELIPAQYKEEVTYTPKIHKEKKAKKLLEKSCVYKCDFMYYNKDGKLVVEDVKGYRAGGAYAVFRIKKKLMLWVHGIRVMEV